jgi:hypothetical protein
MHEGKQSPAESGRNVTGTPCTPKATPAQSLLHVARQRLECVASAPLLSGRSPQAGAGAALILLLACSVIPASASTKERHTVELIHPGISETDPVERTLVHVQRRNSKPDEFYIDVDSVFCKDTVCRVIKIRLYWDELGFYDRLSRKRGTIIEKGNGEPFTEEDYHKLDVVLANRATTVWDLDLRTIGLLQLGEGVDAVSGATVSLDESEYVKGAAWSCYTLWHWVNGGVGVEIRNTMGNTLSVAELRSHLDSDDRRYQAFALEQLARRRSHDPDTAEAVARLASKVDIELLDPILEYAECAPPDLYFQLTGQLVNSGEASVRVKSLNSLRANDRDLPPQFSQRVTDRVVELQAYQELDLWLRVLDGDDHLAAGVVDGMLPLLDSEDFMLARRAYWFLREQPLTESQQEELERFRADNAGMF